MNYKLTLSINPLVAEQAKVYAKSHGKSLSNIVEEYLKSLTQAKETGKKESSLKVLEELQGAVSLPPDFTSYQEVLQDALIEKYLGK